VAKYGGSNSLNDRSGAGREASTDINPAEEDEEEEEEEETDDEEEKEGKAAEAVRIVAACARNADAERVS
jgi:hypothetical protein